jgi:hypothetical protein
MPTRVSPYLAALLIAVLATVTPAAGGGSAASDQVEAHDHEHVFHPSSAGTFILSKTGEGVGCRVASLEERAAMEQRTESERANVRVITPERAEKQSGLTIILRATSQLDRFPEAKAAFISAAAEWESLIANPITIVMDVDFGPNRFGDPWESGVLGSTLSQSLSSPTIYGSVRTRLITGASSPEETALYNALPGSPLPTDEGTTSAVLAASANFRALGLINPVANPSSETNFGDPPSIAFNSAFAYDFDPSDGIDFDKTDFNSVALHEIGHALGFTSAVGFLELGEEDNLVTVLDIFRFRPGVSSSTFTTAQRIVSSGGRQILFTGSRDIELSTGRADGTGGDGEQAGHWKDDVLFGAYIGLMDPRIGDGERNPLTESDLKGFDLIGYRFKPPAPITFTTLGAELRGDILTVEGTASSSAGAIREAQVALVDSVGTVVTTFPRTAISVGTNGTFAIELDGLSEFRSAVKARVTLFGDNNTQSAATEADFSVGDPGAPVLTKSKLKSNGLLTLTGAGFASSLQVEINGDVITIPPGSKVKAMKVKLKSAPLAAGANRVRVILNGLQSNIIVVSN